MPPSIGMKFEKNAKKTLETAGKRLTRKGYVDANSNTNVDVDVDVDRSIPTPYTPEGEQ